MRVLGVRVRLVLMPVPMIVIMRVVMRVAVVMIVIMHQPAGAGAERVAQGAVLDR